jgi:hypothetical protein
MITAPNALGPYCTLELHHNISYFNIVLVPGYKGDPALMMDRDNDEWLREWVNQL